MKPFPNRMGAALVFLVIFGAFTQFPSLGARVVNQPAGQLQPTAPPLDLPQVRLNAADYQAHDLFGFAVDIDGALLVAGAPGQDKNGEDAGGAYLFERLGKNWTERSHLAPGSPEAGSRFGSAVAVDDRTIAVAAPYATVPEAGFAAGAVYVFARQGLTWRQQARLTARDGGSFDLFGSALALDGDTLVVGARGADDPLKGRNAGAAYVFQRDQDAWVEAARLSAGDGAADDFFGQSVALIGDLVAVGAFAHDHPEAGPNAGAVYLFQRYQEAWFPYVELTSSEPEPQAQFGFSLVFYTGAAGPLALVVGANQYSPEPVDPRYVASPGRLEFFRWDNAAWQPGEKLGGEIDPSPEAGMLGSSLALGQAGQDRVILAAGGQLSRHTDLFLKIDGGWKKAGMLAPDEFQILYGNALDISGSDLVIGSPWASERIPNNQFFDEIPQSGAVFIVDLNGLK